MIKQIKLSQPANCWEEGLIAGNGELGVILFGDSHEERLIGSHHRLFLKCEDMNFLPDMAPVLPDLRRMIETDGYSKASQYYEQSALAKGYQGLTMSDPFHPIFELTFKRQQASVQHYERQIDLTHGVIQTSVIEVAGQGITKEVFVPKGQSKIYVKLSSNQPLAVTISLSDFQEEGLFQKMVPVKQGLCQRNTYGDQTGYETHLTWETDGNACAQCSQVSFKEVTELTLQLEVVLSDKWPVNYQLPTLSYEDQRQQHVTAFSQRFNQTDFSLADSQEWQKTQEELMAELQVTQQIPTIFFEKLYHMSRYVILSYSGKGLPNLQGIWTGTFTPAWSGDYTFDTNVQLAISSLASLGLFEEYEQVFRHLADFYDDFEINAKSYYNCPGYLVPVHASTTARHVHWNSEWPLIFWTAGGAWLAHFYFELWEYQQDEVFLKKVCLPFHQQIIAFYLSFLQEKEGEVLFQPSYSAENGMGDNATMDIAALKEVLVHTIEMLTMLKEPLPEAYLPLLQSLPAYDVSENGVLREWLDLRTSENFNHRHFSQFYPIFQSKELTKTSEVLWQGAQQAYTEKMSAWLLNDQADTSSSHGRIHAIMCGISLERLEEVTESFELLIRRRAMYSTMVTSHYDHGEVFNVDTNGAFPKVIHDCLCYMETPEHLTLFKLVPYWLEKGKMSGIFLPKGVIINQIVWNIKEGQARIELYASQRTELTISLGNIPGNKKGTAIKVLELAKGQTKIVDWYF